MMQNFIPVLSREEYIKRSQKRLINKTSSGIGFLIFAYYGILAVSSVVLVVFMEIMQIGTIDLVPLLYINTFIAVLSGFIPALFYFLLAKRTISDTVDTKYTPIQNILAITFLGLAVAMIANIATNIIISNFEFWGIKNNVDSSLDVSTLEQAVLMVVSTAIVPAFIEEFVFRGILVGVLRKYGDAFAIITSAIMFGLMHRNITQIPFAFILGLLMAFVYCKTNSLISCIFIHFFNNFYAVISQIVYSSNILSERMYSVVFAIVCFVFFLIGFISFMYLIKKDKNFFKISDSSSLPSSDGIYVSLTLKEKLKEFFGNVGILFAVIILIFETIFNTGITWIK